jgi:5'(3')-deoxyribonucleotidase
MVDANIYIEDSPDNVAALEVDRDVIVFTNSTNRNVSFSRATRADDWAAAESIVMDRYQAWLVERGQQTDVA